jgi:serine/threonine-protein kinase
MEAGVTLGTVLGGTYEIMRLIGKGGMGAVYEAKHLRLPGKKVAIKVLLAGIATDSEAYARFRREAEIASRLGHPNIVEVLDFNTLPDGTPYLVLEMLSGESLATRLVTGKMALPAAMSIARQIGSALHTAHQSGVVHRDLKPDNIFLCPRDVDGDLVDHVKILDFGISKIRGSQTVLTQEATILGTPQYMAPEQATGKNQQVDARTDIFALGAIVFEMLCGKPAFSGNTLAEVIFQVVYQPPQFLPELQKMAPEHVVAAVVRAMAKNADERYADMAQFIEALTGRPLRAPTAKRSMNVDAMASTAAAPAPSDAFAPTVPPSQPPKPITSIGLASGEVKAVPPTEKVRRGGMGVLVAGAMAVVAGVAAFVFWRGQQQQQQQPTAAARPDASIMALAPSKPDAAVVSVAADAAATETAHVEKHHETQSETTKAETLPPEAAADLADARKALDAGDIKEAVRKVEHSLRVKQSGRAYGMLAESYCVAGDIGAVRAWWPHVAKGDRKRISAVCKKHGLDVAP